MQPINIKRLKKLINTFNAIPAKHIDMGAITLPGKGISNRQIGATLRKIVKHEQQGCGSTCCLFGAFPLAFPKDFKYDHADVVPRNAKIQNVWMGELAGNYIGGDAHWWGRLFTSFYLKKRAVLRELKQLLEEAKEEQKCGSKS